MDTYACLRPDRQAFTKSSRQTLLPLPHLKQEWQARTYSPRLKVGLTWRSMLSTVYRDRHYFKVEELAPLAELRDVDFWLLQPKVEQHEIDYLQSIVNLHIPEGLDLKDDFEGQIALTSCLDCIVSPYSTPGDLAGATETPMAATSSPRRPRLSPVTRHTTKR